MSGLSNDYLFLTSSYIGYLPKFPVFQEISEWIELDWLFNVTINDISVIYVTAHRCAGGPKKKLDLRSGSHAIDFS